MAKRANDSLHRSGAPTAASPRGNTAKRARAESEARSKSMSLPSTAASESDCRSSPLPSTAASESDCRSSPLPSGVESEGSCRSSSLPSGFESETRASSPLPSTTASESGGRSSSLSSGVESETPASSPLPSTAASESGGRSSSLPSGVESETPASSPLPSTAASESSSGMLLQPSTTASESSCRGLPLPSSGESEARRRSSSQPSTAASESSCRISSLPTDGVVTTSCSLSSSRNLRAQWIYQQNGRLAILLILDQLFLRVDARPSTSTHTLSSVAQTLLIVPTDEAARCSSERRKIHRSIEWRGFVLTPEMEPSEFRNTFRVTPSAFASLLHTLQPAIEKKTTNFGEPLSASVRLAVFLYFIGHGCSLQQLRSQFGIGKSTASGIVREVSKAVVGLMQSYVVFPARRDELLKLSMEFEDGYGIPGCVGALDGCHIPIVQPSRPNSKKVFNRKGFYSLSMSAVVDRHRRFLDVDVRWPGSVGDNRVFSNSAVGRMHDLILSEAGGAQGAGFLQTGLEEYRKIPFFLLADSAYANSTHVVTTYEIAEADKDVVVSKLNRKLAGMRYSVECAFGVAKSRWRVLAKPIETSRTNLEDVPTLVSAVCILHNFVIDKNDGVWDARAEARRRAFYFANYLTLTNEEACPDSQTSQEKNKKCDLQLDEISGFG